MSEKRATILLAALPPILLVAVAILQIELAFSEHLSPWKGGGFGMFSSTDIDANRTIRVYLRRGAHAIEVRPDDRHRRLLQDTRVLPSEARLSELARRVAADEAARGPIDTVRVEVWRRTFEPDLDPHPIVLRQLEVTVE